jgi:hypothetical protein
VSVLIRRLSIAEVHERQRARHAAEVAAHNAGIVEHLGQRIPRRRVQVLDEFDPTTRRMAR